MKYQNIFKSPFEGEGYGDLSADVWKVTFCAFEEENAKSHVIYIIACSLSDAVIVAEHIMNNDYGNTAIVSMERLVGYLVAAPNIEMVAVNDSR